MRSRPAAIAAPRQTGRARSPRARVRGFLGNSAANGRLQALLLSVGLSVFVVAFLVSEEFVVTTVVVEGNKTAYADSIVAWSGALGAQIFRLDTERVAEQVVRHPAVASVDVRAQFPNKVVVRLTERSPAVVWQVDQRAVLVDERGWVIAEGYDETLPRLIQPAGELPRPGAQVDTTRVQAIRFLSTELGPTLGQLTVDPSRGLIAQLTNGKTLVLGGNDQIPLKLSVYRSAVEMQRSWGQLDVRDPDRPFFQ